MAKNLGKTIGTVVGGVGGTLIAPGIGTALGASLGGMAGGAVDAMGAEDNAKYARSMGMFGGPRVRPLPPEMMQTSPPPLPALPEPIQQPRAQQMPGRNAAPAPTQTS